MAWPVDDEGRIRGIYRLRPVGPVPIADIEESLGQLLPPYMMPSSVHRLADWPLNDNGKTDYSCLKSFAGS